MGMSPTATLTYGFDFELPETNWAEEEEADWEACNILRATEGMPSYVGVHKRTDDGRGWRLYACFRQASGWREPMVADDNELDIPETADADMRRAAEVLGIVLPHAKPYWLMTAEFN